MTRTGRILAVAVVLAGLVWSGQGIGVLRAGSLMLDGARWTPAGALRGAVGVRLVVAARRAGAR